MIIEQKYIELLSSELRNFKQVRRGVYNFSCPLCGDSVSSKKKSRGYFLLKDSNYIYFCHNCLESISFYNFLKTYDERLFSEYKRELYKESGKGDKIYKKKEEIDSGIFIPKKNDLVVCVDSLPDSHRAKQYLLKRNVPKVAFQSVFWSDNFPKLINENFPGKYPNVWLKEGLVFFTSGNGIIGRTIENSKIRFFKGFDDHYEQHIFHHCVDETRPVFIVEGSIDALFLNNSYATMNASLYKLSFFDNDIVFHDQECRSEQIVSQMEKTINANRNIVLLGYEYSGMDINDIVNKTGKIGIELENFLIANSYRGLKAHMIFAKWRKV